MKIDGADEQSDGARLQAKRTGVAKAVKIDGREIANKILDDLKKRVGELQKKNITPNLAIILVGEDPASVSYVNQKRLKAEQIGAKTTIINLPPGVSESQLLKIIQQFNDDRSIHGLIIQQPLPPQINIANVINAVDPRKDVDGFLPNSSFQIPIAAAVFKILEEVYSASGVAKEEDMVTPLRPSGFEGQAGPATTNWLKSKKIVVMGKGKTAGGPIAQMLKTQDLKPTIIDSKTLSPESITREADIVICAVGKANILRPEMLKKDVVLIDVGISRGESAKLMGDYDQNEIENLASFYTPTPGGVGPVNVACLLKNLVLATENN